MKRFGLDYRPHVRLSEYASWEAFLDERSPRPDQLVHCSRNSAVAVSTSRNTPDDAMLVFGQETKGIPVPIIDQHPGRLFHLPMRSDVIRSLNLANTVSAAAYQALRGTF